VKGKGLISQTVNSKIDITKTNQTFQSTALFRIISHEFACPVIK
jgi:hypothetical protein